MGIPCDRQPETRLGREGGMGLVKLQRAVKYGPPSLVLASLARDAVEDAGLEGDAGLYTPKALRPAFQGDVHQIESLVNSVGKH